MRKAFTLIELMVAVGILVVILSFAGVMFRASVETYRMGVANIEIMRKCQAITDCLDADLAGLEPDYSFVIDVENVAGINKDRIAFIAMGNFRSIWSYGGKAVSGNVAGIFYGHAENDDVLLRRQTILTSDYSLPDSLPTDEYYKYSISEWMASPPLSVNGWLARPTVSVLNEKSVSMYLADGTESFTIEYYGGIEVIGEFPFLYEKLVWVRSDRFDSKIRALKFTFTLWDSNSIISKVFTHIVLIR